MKLRLRIVPLIILAATSAFNIYGADRPKCATAADHQLSCESLIVVQTPIITALRASNETLNLRVAALSQLLTVAQRMESDAATLDAISEAERKVLAGMGLSVTDCNVNLDGSVDCKPNKKVEE